jgi:hypothetical protein
MTQTIPPFKIEKITVVAKSRMLKATWTFDRSETEPYKPLGNVYVIGKDKRYYKRIMNRERKKAQLANKRRKNTRFYIV